MYTDVACLLDSEMVLSYLLLVCYEIRIVHFVYQPIKSLSRYLWCVHRVETPVYGNENS